MKVPFVDFKRMHGPLMNEFEAAFSERVSKGDFILGEAVGKFEEEFASYCGSSYACGVSSGTEALHMALLAAGIGPGDEVITAANTFIATVLAIYYTGARPVLVDADPQTYNMDVSKAEKAVTSKTKAIVPVHLYGRPADMDAVNSLADSKGLKVIEDACQAHGAFYKGHRAGSMSSSGCFSFFPAKNLGAFGDGGIIVTNDAATAEKIRKFRNYGSPKKYVHDIKGFNNRLDTVQASMLRIKLSRLDGWNEARRAAAGFYRKGLEGTSYVLPPEDNGVKQVYHLFVIRTEKREELQKFLAGNGISTGIHYPIPIHLCPAFSDLGYSEGDFPVTEKYAQEILSLPMFPGLTEDEAGYVCEKLREFSA